MHRLLLFVLIAILLLRAEEGRAVDWQQIHHKHPQGIEKVEQSNNQIFVKNQKGQWSQVGLTGNKLTFTPSAPSPKAQIIDPDRLPDTEVAMGTNKIRRAWFTQPTRRYGHGVLGDAIEAGALKAELENGQTAEVMLSERAVFEDRTPRLADINRDGTDEIIVVKSYLDRGAAVVLVGPSDTGIEIVAEAPAIGLSHRWLNPVGAADFDGDGTVEIAVVITPHIGGTLQLYEWQKNKLVADHSAFGFSNHAMGSRELGLSAIIDLDQDGIPDILLPDASRRSLIAVSFAGGQSEIIQRFDAPHPFSSGLYVSDLDQNGVLEIIYATDNSELTIIKQNP